MVDEIRVAVVKREAHEAGRGTTARSLQKLPDRRALTPSPAQPAHLLTESPGRTVISYGSSSYGEMEWYIRMAGMAWPGRPASGSFSNFSSPTASLIQRTLE
jgi:hypothetical protein